MVLTDELFQTLNLALLLFDLLLLFLDGVDENDADAIILDAFDLASRIACNQQRFDGCHIFRPEAEITLPAVAPVETDRAQAVDDSQSGAEWSDLRFVAQARRAGGNLIGRVNTQLFLAGISQRVYSDDAINVQPVLR